MSMMRRNQNQPMIESTPAKMSAITPIGSSKSDLMYSGCHTYNASAASGGITQSIFGAAAEAYFGEHPLQLSAHRRPDFLGDRLKTLHEREAGAQRAREQRQGIGQLALERLLPVALAVRDVEIRDTERGECADQPRDRSDEDRDQQENKNREERHVED